MIRKEKWQSLQQEMLTQGLYEDDLQEKFTLGSGPGGQKKQKSQTAVYLKHIPSGMETKSARSRSREDNRFFARRQLLKKWTQKYLEEQARIRKQKKRRKRRSSQK